MAFFMVLVLGREWKGNWRYSDKGEAEVKSVRSHERCGGGQVVMAMCVTPLGHILNFVSSGRRQSPMVIQGERGGRRREVSKAIMDVGVPIPFSTWTTGWRKST